MRLYEQPGERPGVGDKPFTLYTGFPSLIPCSSSMSDETEPWARLHITLAVGGMLTHIA